MKVRFELIKVRAFKGSIILKYVYFYYHYRMKCIIYYIFAWLLPKKNLESVAKTFKYCL
jgi:hypothetical protein